MRNRHRSILFVGAPGAGKGTLSQAIGQLPGFYWFGTGAALRALQPDSELGIQVQPYLQRGDLVPNALVIEVWKQHLKHAGEQGEYFPRHDFALLDGLPRDIAQATALESYVDMQLVVHLKVDDDELLKNRIRQRNARPDDRDEAVIEHRFRVYHERTAPLLTHYGAGKVVEIDAAQRPLRGLEQVAREIRTSLAVD